MKYYYCYNIKNGLFEEEIEYAKDLGLYIYYDELEDKFFDKYHNEINIKGILIFPRSGVQESNKLVNNIIRHGGNSLVKKEDYDQTLNWPYYIKTKRNNIILSGRQILETPQIIVDIFGTNKVFFKTKHKNFSGIIDISNFLGKNNAFISALKEHLDDDFIISDAVNIDKDKHGPLEYRAFVIKNEIFNISRISENLLCSIPKEVIDKLREVVNILKETDFPKSYVIDLFIYTDNRGKKSIDILECNPIIASGTYLYNSIFEKTLDLEHKCPSASIPKEKIKYSKRNRNTYSFNAVNNTTPSIFYHLPGGFAADWTSFRLFGTKSTKDSYFHISSTNRQINLLELKPIEQIITDDGNTTEILYDTKKLLRTIERQ